VEPSTQKTTPRAAHLRTLRTSDRLCVGCRAEPSLAGGAQRDVWPPYHPRPRVRRRPAESHVHARPDRRRQDRPLRVNVHVLTAPVSAVLPSADERKPCSEADRARSRRRQQLPSAKPPRARADAAPRPLTDVGGVRRHYVIDHAKLASVSRFHRSRVTSTRDVNLAAWHPPEAAAAKEVQQLGASRFATPVTPRSSAPAHPSQIAGSATSGWAPGKRLIPAKTDEANGLLQDPLRPAQGQGSSGLEMTNSPFSRPHP